MGKPKTGRRVTKERWAVCKSGSDVWVGGLVSHGTVLAKQSPGRLRSIKHLPPLVARAGEDPLIRRKC